MARPLLPRDLLRLRVAQSPTLSADGRIAFVVQENDEEHDERTTSLWLADGRRARRFTSGSKDSAPRFSPDGRTLAFLRADREKARLHLMPLDGGEARPVDRPRDGIAALRWSPDGRRIAFVARAERAPEACVFLDERSGARHIRTLRYKSDEFGLADGRRRHLFVFDLEREETVQITAGEYDVDAPSWSPDGTSIAFSSQIDVDEASFIFDIWLVDLDDRSSPPGRRAMRRLTQGRGLSVSPVFSPDGRWVAYVGHERGEDVAGSYNRHLYVVPYDGGEARCLSETFHYGVGDHVIDDTRGHGGDLVAWSRDARSIVTVATVEGSVQIVRFDVTDGSATRLVGGDGRTLLAADVNGDRVAFVYSDPRTPAELAVCDLDGGNERTLTDLNPWLAEVELATPERLRPRHADGTELDLWILHPAGGSPAHALVFQIHGGPHGCYGTGFFFEFQMLAGRGIAVAYGNIRGSQGYGEAFSRALVGRWGSLDVDDALTLLDAASAHLQVDPARIAVAGGSYGGYLTAVLMGRSPERFACGIAMRSVNALASEIGTSDMGWFLEREVEASLLNGDVERLYRISPLALAAAYRAPLLILHSERDFRCPIGQAEELFQLLRRSKKPVEMVRFEKDGHGLSREGHPRNRILRLRAIAHWLERWLMPERHKAEHAGWLLAPLDGEA